MKPKLLAMVVLTALLASQGMASSKEVEDLLAKMRNAYKSVKTARFRTKVDALGQKRFRNRVVVDVLYQAPKMLTLRAMRPGEVYESLVSDGRRILKVTARSETQVDIATIDTLTGGLPINLESICFFDWKRQLSTDVGCNMHTSQLGIKQGQVWNGKTWLVLTEAAPGRSGMTLLEYYIDPKTYLIWRVIGHLQDGEKTVDAYLMNLSVNVPVKVEAFKMPAGRNVAMNAVAR